MSVTFSPIGINDLTTASVDGSGAFDVLMRATKEHLEQEFRQGRLKGNEYAQVYLASTQSVLTTALQFVLSKEAQNLEYQIKAKEVELQQQRLALLQQEVALATARLANIPKEGALLDAQAAKFNADTQVSTQQRLNLQDELLTAAKQRDRLTQEIANLAAEKLRVESQTALSDQQKANLLAEAANIPKAGAKLDADTALVGQQRLNLISEELGIDARTALVTQQATNAVTENTVLVAQECKLRAEFDVLVNTKAKGDAEIALLTQKKLTEAAQISGSSVDPDSVIGRQKALFSAQAAGFTRDAEQKAADLLIRSWVARKTADPDGTVADGVNQLGDSAVGRAVGKLLNGVGA